VVSSAPNIGSVSRLPGTSTDRLMPRSSTRAATELGGSMNTSSELTTRATASAVGTQHFHEVRRLAIDETHQSIRAIGSCPQGFRLGPAAVASGVRKSGEPAPAFRSSRVRTQRVAGRQMRGRATLIVSTADPELVGGRTEGPANSSSASALKPVSPPCIRLSASFACARLSAIRSACRQRTARVRQVRRMMRLPGTPSRLVRSFRSAGRTALRRSSYSS